MLRAIGQDADATEAYEAALKIAEELQDGRAQASELPRDAVPAGPAMAAPASQP